MHPCLYVISVSLRLFGVDTGRHDTQHKGLFATFGITVECRVLFIVTLSVMGLRCRAQLNNLWSVNSVDTRVRFVSGEYEPTDAECEWPSDDEDDELAEEVKDKVL